MLEDQIQRHLALVPLTVANIQQSEIDHQHVNMGCNIENHSTPLENYLHSLAISENNSPPIENHSPPLVIS